MELAKKLAQWRDTSPEQWIALANRYLPPIVVAVLVLLLALEAADLTWRLLEAPAEQDTVPPPVSVGAPTGRSVPTSYGSLAAWEPFGHAPDEAAGPIAAEEILDAPDTSLNLRLTGLVSVAQELPERGTTIVPEEGRAVIASGRGQQKVYRTGDPIEDVGNVTLHSIFTDGVRLENNGRLETLRWDESESATASRSNSRLSASPQARQLPPQSLSGTVAVTEAVTQTVAQLSQHMQIAAHSEGGQMIGFRFQPRGDGQVFAELGLEPGDVLTEVNGLRLDDVRNAARVLQALSETPQSTVTIRRNGTDQTMVLDIGQIQRLAESRQ